MTKIQLGIIGAVIVGATVPLVFQHQAQIRMRHKNDGLRSQVDQLFAENGRLSNELAQARKGPPPVDTSEELLRLRAEVARLRRDSQELAQAKAQAKPAGDERTDAAARSWLARLDQLKQRLSVTPGASIPEFQFLTEEDWLRAARGELNTDTDYRRAFATLRASAEGKVAPMLKKAVDRYKQANADGFPTDLKQLNAYFDPPLEEAVLARWGVLPAKTIDSLAMGGDWIITQKAAVDDVFDMRYGIGPNGWGSTDFSTRESTALTAAVFEAYRNANNGQTPEDTSLLLPYASTPEQKSALEKLILRRAAQKN